MLAAVGCGAAGKNKKTNASDKNAKAIALTNMPAAPRLKRDGKRASPRTRRANMQPMTTMYEDTRPSWPREVITLKAIVEPRMMRQRCVVQTRVVKMEFTGTSQTG